MAKTKTSSATPELTPRAIIVGLVVGIAILSSAHRMLSQADARMLAASLTPAEVDAEVAGEVADEFGGAPDAIDLERHRLERTRDRLRLAPVLAVERKRAALENTAAKLAALSPLQTLRRGYAIVRTEQGDVVASTEDVSEGARVDVTLAEGGFGARVEEVTP